MKAHRSIAIASVWLLLPAGIGASAGLLGAAGKSDAHAVDPRIKLLVRTGGSEIDAWVTDLYAYGRVRLIAGAPVQIKLFDGATRVRVWAVDSDMTRIGRGRTAQVRPGTELQGWRCTLPRRLPPAAKGLLIRVLYVRGITNTYLAKARVRRGLGQLPRDAHPCFDPARKPSKRGSEG